MMIKGISVMLILLASSLALPVGFSYANSNETESLSDEVRSQNATNETDANQTNNFGQQVSDFIH